MQDNLYMSSTLCWNYPIEIVLNIAASNGFNGVEIWAEQVWQHQSSVVKVNKARKQAGIKATMHAPCWDINICSLNKGIRHQSLKEIIKSFHLAVDLGIQNITIHPGKITILEEWGQIYQSLLRESIIELAEISEKLGLSMSIELTDTKRRELIYTSTFMNELFRDLPSNVYTTFDIAHAPLEVDIELFYKQINRINKIHISDLNATECHVPLGKGSIPLHQILFALTITDIPLVIEGLDATNQLTDLKSNLTFLSHHSLLGYREIIV